MQGDSQVNAQPEMWYKHGPFYNGYRGNPDVDGRIILKWILKWERVVGTGWSWLRIGTGGGHL
jgi:hypothetical protein